MPGGVLVVKCSRSLALPPVAASPVIGSRNPIEPAEAVAEGGPRRCVPSSRSLLFLFLWLRFCDKHNLVSCIGFTRICES